MHSWPEAAFALRAHDGPPPFCTPTLGITIPNALLIQATELIASCDFGRLGHAWRERRRGARTAKPSSSGGADRGELYRPPALQRRLARLSACIRDRGRTRPADRRLLFGTFHTSYAIAGYIAACAVISLVAAALMTDRTGASVKREYDEDSVVDGQRLAR